MYSPNRQRNDEKLKTMNGGFFNKLQSISLGFFWSLFNSVDLLTKGLNVAPQTTPLSMIPAMIHMDPFQPYRSRSPTDNGAKTKVPTPDPHDAIPVARALRFSK